PVRGFRGIEGAGALVTAAAAAAAAAAPAAGRGPEARLGRLRLRREDGELTDDLRRAAVRASGVLTCADELLEVALALHAHVLVDRHALSLSARARSLRARPADLHGAGACE